MECFKESNAVWEQRTWSTFLGAESNPNLVRKGFRTWGTGFVPAPGQAVCAHSLSLPVSDLDPLGTKCPLRKDTDPWLCFSWKCCWLWKLTCSGMLEPVWETTCQNLLSDKPPESCCHSFGNDCENLRVLRDSLNSKEKNVRNWANFWVGQIYILLNSLDL